jgi:S1-C subfamily serine protease
MKRTLTVIAVCLLSLSAESQNVLTGKEIYRINCKSVVQIQTDEGFGVGFIVSQDGLIVTANHVVTTRKSNFREYAGVINVAVFGKPALYSATPVTAAVSDDQANYDSAIIRIKETKLPHVALGEWDSADIGDPVTIVASFPSFGCILLEGSVAVKGSIHNGMGPKPVNAIIFQSPIRNGFSGSPIFNSKGRVIGIEDTKVFGISTVLDEQRKKWVANNVPGAAVQVSIQMGPGGADVGASIVELINNLDQNLISGLGSGVDVTYAKKQQEDWQQHPH